MDHTKLRAYNAAWEHPRNPTGPADPHMPPPEGELHAMQYRWLGLGAEMKMVGRTDLVRLWALMHERQALAALIVEQGMTLPDEALWRHPPLPEDWPARKAEAAGRAQAEYDARPRLQMNSRDTKKKEEETNAENSYWFDQPASGSA